MARRIEHVYTPENEAPSLFSEAMAKYRAGDLDGALAALRVFVGAPDREIAVEARPYVVSALLGIAGILDFQGEAESALEAYDVAFTRFQSDSEVMSHAWLAEALAKARTRRDWLARNRRASRWWPAVVLYSSPLVGALALTRWRRRGLG